MFSEVVKNAPLRHETVRFSDIQPVSQLSNSLPNFPKLGYALVKLIAFVQIGVEAWLCLGQVDCQCPGWYPNRLSISRLVLMLV